MSQLIYLTVTNRGQNLDALAAGPTVYGFDVEDIVTPIRYNSNLSKAYFTARTNKDGANNNINGSKVDYRVSETLVQIAAKSPFLLRLSVAERRGVEFNETQIFISSKISENLIPLPGNYTKFYYIEDGDPLPVEYIVRDSILSIITQQADNLPPSVVQIVELTWQEAQDIRDAGLLDADDGFTPGTFYKITDANETDGGLVIQAISPTQLSLSGDGIFLNADYQDVGDYSGLPAPKGVNKGVWIDTEEIKATVSNIGGNLTDGTYVAEPFVGGSGVGFTADVEVVGGEVVSISNVNFGAGYLDGDVLIGSGIPGAPLITFPQITISAYSDGDVVFWGGIHYQVADASQIDGTNPATNMDAYVVAGFAKSTTIGYIEEVDLVHYDFDGNKIIFRADKRGNRVQCQFASFEFFQWGNDDVYTNIVNNECVFDIVNQRGEIGDNTLNGYCTVRCNNTHISYMGGNTFSGGITYYANFTTGSMAACVLNPSTSAGTSPDITFLPTDNYNGFVLAGTESTFEATVDMSDAAVYAGTVLTLPLQYKNYIGILKLENADTSSIDEIVNAPKRVRYYAKIGESYDFVFQSLGTLSSRLLIRDSGAGTLTVVGRNLGKDYLEFERDEHSVNPNLVYVSKLTIPSILS
jgi:hypothetical protein